MACIGGSVSTTLKQSGMSAVRMGSYNVFENGLVGSECADQCGHDFCDAVI